MQVGNLCTITRIDCKRQWIVLVSKYVIVMPASVCLGSVQCDGMVKSLEEASSPECPAMLPSINNATYLLQLGFTSVPENRSLRCQDEHVGSSTTPLALAIRSYLITIQTDSNNRAVQRRGVDVLPIIPWVARRTLCLKSRGWVSW